MEELVHTDDPVFLSALMAALNDAGIDAVVFDAHAAGMFPGVMDALSRRVMVDADVMPRAQCILRDVRDAAPAPFAEPETTEDSLLDGRVRLRQPVDGYRAAIDPVLLAASVPARAGQAVLDAGCGVGAAALCLLARVDGVQVTGVECQPALADLARINAGGQAFHVVDGDITDPPETLTPGSFDHVMANPPYMEAETGHAPPNPSKATAHVEAGADMGDWVRFCFAMVKRKGTVTFIHRADRLEGLLGALGALKGEARAGDIVVFPLWSGPGKPAKRVLVRARKGVATPTTLAPGLVLHQPDGGFTPEAAGVLRNAAFLPL